MASTTIPDVKAALLTMFEGISVLSDDAVDVRYAVHPERRRNAVWLGDVSTGEIEPAGFKSGRFRRLESFTVAVFIEARATSPAKAEVLAFTYARAIEEALADDPKLSETANLSWALVEELDSVTADGGDGAYCQIELTVRCQGSFQ